MAISYFVKQSVRNVNCLSACLNTVIFFAKALVEIPMRSPLIAMPNRWENKIYDFQPTSCYILEMVFREQPKGLHNPLSSTIFNDVK